MRYSQDSILDWRHSATASKITVQPSIHGDRKIFVGMLHLDTLVSGHMTREHALRLFVALGRALTNPEAEIARLVNNEGSQE